MLGGFSAGEKAMFLKRAWMSTENKGIVSSALVNQKPVNEKSLHQTSTVLLSSCNLVFSSKLLLSCLPDEHKGRNVIQQELVNCNRRLWACVMLSKRLRKRVCES